MSSLANVRILKRYYAILLSSHSSSDNMVTKFMGYHGTRITGQLPQLQGKITWVWAKKNLLRERYFILEGRNKRDIPISPDRVRKIFHSTKFLLLDKNISSQLLIGIRGYIKDFQFNLKINEYTNCPYCELLNRITLMTPKIEYIGLNKQKICQNCALMELQRELKGRQVQITPTITRYLQILLQQSRNVLETLDVISGSQQYGSGSVVREVDKLIGDFHSPVPIKSLKPQLPDYIFTNLVSRNITVLYPTQVKALKAGLLNKTKDNTNNLLIVADTSAGKTLIGEMAALRTILVLKKQVLYLAPLVALANTKYDSFRKYFKSEQFKIGIRVGKTRIKVRQRKTKPDSQNLLNKNIIVGTYEGVDQLIRIGHSFENIGLVIIDEIQTLQEEDRGPDLDGLITRLILKNIKIQILGLSATIGNPKELASALNLKLVQYKGRPIPLEVHLLISPSELMKKERIAEIVDTERKIKSKYNFKGQTIIFTNARRKTKELRDYLRNTGIRCTNYHSGLPYGIRKRIEEDFDQGKMDAVVATYALGAGVDFPASTVIFESLLMGRDLLTDRVNIFFQMMGRAGRLGKHEKGKVILLATPYPPNASTQKSELEIAMDLLNNTKYENVEPSYDLNITTTQLLATLASFKKGLSHNKWKMSLNMLIGGTGDLNMAVTHLLKKKLIAKLDSNQYQVTNLGKAGALSFLTVDNLSTIQNLLVKYNSLEVGILMEPFEGIQLAPRLIGFIERALKTRINARLFSSNALDLLDSASIKVQKLDKTTLQLLMKWNQLFFNCDCKDRPYCDHGLINVNKLLLQLRLEGLSPEAIAQTIDRKYGLWAYPGDLLRWLESLLHRLNGIHKITLALKFKLKIEINELINQIENPRPDHFKQEYSLFPSS